MKHQWLAYVVVALLSIGAGVAIAGVPRSGTDAASVAVVATTTATTTTVGTTSSVAPTTVAPTTVPPTTVPPTTVPASTTSGPTTSTSTTTSTVPVPDRADIIAAAANGTTQNGIAQETADKLESVGYVDVRAFTGTDKVDVTVVYYADGFEAAASRLADDLGIDSNRVAPLTTAPLVVDLGSTQVLVYVGNDRR